MSFLALVILVLFFPKPTLAYIDPGTGSYFFQLAIGFFLGGIFIIKAYWQKIKSFFFSIFKKRSRKQKRK